MNLALSDLVEETHMGLTQQEPPLNLCIPIFGVGPGLAKPTKTLLLAEKKEIVCQFGPNSSTTTWLSLPLICHTPNRFNMAAMDRFFHQSPRGSSHFHGLKSQFWRFHWWWSFQWWKLHGVKFHTENSVRHWFSFQNTNHQHFAIPISDGQLQFWIAFYSHVCSLPYTKVTRKIRDTSPFINHIWVNYTISLNWIKTIWGWFPY